MIQLGQPDSAFLRHYRLHTVTLRQRAFPILLAFLLLLSQQMGMAHAISHLSSGLTSSASHDKHLPSQMQCDQCVAFASIGSAVPNPPVSLFVDISTNRVAVDARIGKLLFRTIRAFDSRAPPVPYL
jgi:hypothetical protein